jgi:hypothetical protein
MRQSEALLVQRIAGSHHGNDVFGLVESRKGRGDVADEGLLIPEQVKDQVPGALTGRAHIDGGVDLISECDAASVCLRRPFEDSRGIGLGLPDDDRDAWFDDARLFRCNFGDRIAKQLGMVKAYVGDHGEEGADDVG